MRAIYEGRRVHPGSEPRGLELERLSEAELDALERFTGARLAATEVASDTKDSDEQK